jgi:hypothetical protein
MSESTIMADLFDCQHFSLSNPSGSLRDDVPALLRRVADTIEAIGDVHVLDITYSVDIDVAGYCPWVSVYFTAAAPSGANA